MYNTSVQTTPERSRSVPPDGVPGGVREILATGHLFVTKTSPGIPILPGWWPHWAVMQGPAGAFITLGALMGLVNYLGMRKRK